MRKADHQFKLSSKVISQWSASLTAELQEGFNRCTELAILKAQYLGQIVRAVL